MCSHMTKILIILLFALVVEAVGVVFLSKGLKQIGEVQILSAREIGRIIVKGSTNADILAGVALIMIGAALVSYSEKNKPKPPAPGLSGPAVVTEPK